MFNSYLFKIDYFSSQSTTRFVFNDTPHLKKESRDLQGGEKPSIKWRILLRKKKRDTLQDDYELPYTEAR